MEDPARKGLARTSSFDRARASAKRVLKRSSSFERGQHSRFLFVCEPGDGVSALGQMYQWVAAIRRNTVDIDMGISAPQLVASSNASALQMGGVGASLPPLPPKPPPLASDASLSSATTGEPGSAAEPATPPKRPSLTSAYQPSLLPAARSSLIPPASDEPPAIEAAPREEGARSGSFNNVWSRKTGEGRTSWRTGDELHSLN